MQLQTFFTLTLMLFHVHQNVRAQGDKDDGSDSTSEGPQAQDEALQKPMESRIAGGIDVKPHSYASIVLMMIGGNFTCGGTILNEEWVLSAANCVNSTNPNEYSFLAGRHDRTKEEASEQKVTAVKLLVHQGYTDTLENDIALFKVSPKFKFNDKVKATVLATKNWSYKKGNAIVAGWGKTAWKNVKGSNILQQVWIPIVSNNDCLKLMGYIHDTNICAGTTRGGKDACPGDAGGPLFFKEKAAIIQVGVVSWGDGCGKRARVGVYTRVSKYLDWIKDNAGIEIG